VIENGPIFVGGLDRSGKTPLCKMLGRHPHLAFTRRTYLWTRFYKRYGDLAQPENLEHCLQAMLEQSAVQALQPDVERIRREFGQGPATYARLFELIHRHHAERLGKPRWGDQLGLVERFAETIFASYHNAKMIHLVRDPRDRYAAANAARGPGWKAGWSVARWLYSARLAELNRQRFPGRYLVLRYESLVQDPEKKLETVCDFLGETFDPCMLEPENRLEEDCAEQEDFQVRPISAGETAFVQLTAAREMRRLGYGLERVRFSAGNAAAFTLVDLPLNLAGMMYWRLVEKKDFNG
jgi:hypothetical protein